MGDEAGPSQSEDIFRDTFFRPEIEQNDQFLVNLNLFSLSPEFINYWERQCNKNY